MSLYVPFLYLSASSYRFYPQNNFTFFIFLLNIYQQQRSIKIELYYHEREILFSFSFFFFLFLQKNNSRESEFMFGIGTKFSLLYDLSIFLTHLTFLSRVVYRLMTMRSSGRLLMWTHERCFFFFFHVLFLTGQIRFPSGYRVHQKPFPKIRK